MSQAQGLVEDLMDFKSAFPKGDSIRAATVDNCASKLKKYMVLVSVMSYTSTCATIAR